MSGTTNVFSPSAGTVAMSVSTASSSVALPAGPTVVVDNTGSQDAYVFVSTAPSPTVTTTTGMRVPTGSRLQFALSVAGTNYIAAITSTSTTTLLLTPGSGTLQGIAAAGSGGSAGGATAANQTNGLQQTQIVDGSGNVIASTSNALDTFINGGTVVTDSGDPSGYNNRANWLDISQSTTGTAAVTIQAAGTTGVKYFITDIEIANGGSNAVTVLLNNVGATVLPAPANGGVVKNNTVPFRWAAATAITFTPSGSPGGTLSVGMQGYPGT